VSLSSESLRLRNFNHSGITLLHVAMRWNHHHMVRYICQEWR